MAFNSKDYDDYPLGDETAYQNRKKYGSEVHPNSRAAKMHKRLVAYHSETNEAKTFKSKALKKKMK